VRAVPISHEWTLKHRVVVLVGCNSWQQIAERFMPIQRSILRWTANQSGQDLAEYALILAFVVLAVLAELRLFGTDLLAFYSRTIGGLPIAF
jgi:Flp pilus assembly pilin Flp